MTARERNVRAEALDLGVRREKAREELGKINRDLASLVPAAREVGVPLTELAELAGITQPGLYALLRRSSNRRST